MYVRERVFVGLAPFPHEDASLLRDVEVLLPLGFLLLEDEPRELPLLVHVSPCDAQHVAPPQPREAAEQERRLDLRVLAVHLREPFHLVNSEVHPRPLLRLEALNAAQGVVGYDALLERLIDAGSQLVEIAHLAVAGEGLVLEPLADVVMPSDRVVFEVVLEALHPFGRDVGKGQRLPSVVDFQVVVAAAPVAPVAALLLTAPPLHHSAVVVVEICLGGECALEAVHAVAELHHTLGADCVREAQRLLVLLLVRPCPFGDKIQFQILIRAHTVDVDVEP